MKTFNLPSSFVVILSVTSLSYLASTVNADLYQLVLLSNSETALFNAVSDSESIVQDWIDGEPSQAGLVSMSPGETATLGDSSGGVRGLRNLQIGCPSSCHNSGSTFCQSIGCAYCGRCGRRLDGLLGDGRDLMGSQAAVVSQLNDALAPYCDNVDGGDACEIYVQVLKVNDDGTTDELV